MANEIKVDTDRMQRDYEDLEKRIANLEKYLDKMYESVDSLDTMWDGPANDAFRATFENDGMFMINVIDRLVDLTDSIGFARREYINTIEKVNEAINSIKV